MERSPYYNFKNKWLGKRVDYDKFAGYQCVDLAKQYMDEVLTIKPGQTGNANQMRANTYKCFDANRTQIKGTTDLMQGDIVFSIVWTYWHVAIVDRMIGANISVLEQNGSGQNSGNWLWANAIRLHSYNPSFFVGVWRCQKIFDNLQKERAYCDDQVRNTQDYKNAIRYQG